MFPFVLGCLKFVLGRRWLTWALVILRALGSACEDISRAVRPRGNPGSGGARLSAQAGRCHPVPAFYSWGDLTVRLRDGKWPPRVTQPGKGSVKVRALSWALVSMRAFWTRAGTWRPRLTLQPRDQGKRTQPLPATPRVLFPTILHLAQHLS